MSAYTNDGQQRILRLITLLSGNEFHGLAPGAIAQHQACSASVVTRDLANLAQAGFAERVPETGHYRLSPQIVQISLRMGVALARAEARMSEVRARFSRS